MYKILIREENGCWRFYSCSTYYKDNEYEELEEVIEIINALLHNYSIDDLKIVTETKFNVSVTK